MMPTRWMTVSQPAISASSTLTGDRTSPSTRSIASNPCRSGSEPRRTRQRTTWPSARTAWIRDRATKPVAPVTNTRCIAGIVSRPSRLDAKIERVRSKYSIRRGLLAALVLLLPPVAHAQPHDFTAVDDAVQTITAAGDVPGAVVLIGRRDEILYHRAFGW